MKVDDIVLVTRALENPEEFTAIVEKYEHKIDSYLKSIIFASKEDREDILQDIFIATYRFLNSYKSEFTFSTWIYRIAHNQAMSFLRKHKRRLAVEFVSATTEEDEDLLDTVTSDEDIERNVARMLELERVKGKMSLLNTQEREVMLLRYCEQKEYNEIAAILLVPEGTIASVIHRAKAKLKRLLNHDSSK